MIGGTTFYLVQEPILEEPSESGATVISDEAYPVPTLDIGDPLIPEADCRATHTCAAGRANRLSCR